jgi:homoserine O-acetyltransferase
MIGPGKAFDTDRYFVICSNVIGSCRGSTGPGSIDPTTGRPYAMRFPVVTVADMVTAQRALLDVLGVHSLLAVSGGSLGGMQAIEWAVRYPDLVESLIPVAATPRLAPIGVAWNFIAREAIMADPRWRGGDYYDSGEAPEAGLAVARMVGHVTYLSAHNLWEKFGRRLQDRDDVSYSFEPDLAVESYLRHQGSTFVKRFDANAYLYLSRAITYFDLARTWGAGSLERAVAGVAARTLLLSFSHDWLYPPEDSAALETALRANGKDVSHVTLESTYGHDSFLLEEARLTSHIQAFLAETHQRVRAAGQRSPSPQTTSRAATGADGARATEGRRP